MGMGSPDYREYSELWILFWTSLLSCRSDRDIQSIDAKFFVSSAPHSDDLGALMVAAL